MSNTNRPTLFWQIFGLLGCHSLCLPPLFVFGIVGSGDHFLDDLDTFGRYLAFVDDEFNEVINLRIRKGFTLSSYTSVRHFCFTKSAIFLVLLSSPFFLALPIYTTTSSRWESHYSHILENFHWKKRVGFGLLGENGERPSIL